MEQTAKELKPKKQLPSTEQLIIRACKRSDKPELLDKVLSRFYLSGMNASDKVSILSGIIDDYLGGIAVSSFIRSTKGLLDIQQLFYPNESMDIDEVHLNVLRSHILLLHKDVLLDAGYVPPSRFRRKYAN